MGVAVTRLGRRRRGGLQSATLQGLHTRAAGATYETGAVRRSARP